MKRRHVNIEQQVKSVLNNRFLSSIIEEFIVKAESTWNDLNPNEEKKPNVLEIGGAGGITKFLRPDWIITDVRAAPGVDQVVDSDKLPFSNESFDIIIAIDVIHHIQNFDKYLFEVKRVLRNGGVFIVREPYWAFISQIIWRFAHPEDFSLRRLRNPHSEEDPMNGNQALAYAILRKNEFLPNGDVLRLMSINEIGASNGIAFCLSGGATFTTKIPQKLLSSINSIERKSKFWMKLFGFSYTFYFHKNDY